MAQSIDPEEETRLLPNGSSSLVAVEGQQGLRKEPVGAKLTRYALVVIAWSAIIYYVALPYAERTTYGLMTVFRLNEALTAACPYLGNHAIIILLWGGPFLLLVFVGVVYLYFFPRSSRRPIKKKAPRATLGTHPIIVSGPFGIVSAAELIWIVVFTATVIYLIVQASIDSWSKLVEEYPPGSRETLWTHMVAKTSVNLGFIGQICLSLLFLPVARGSVLLRLVDIPFEHAAKYHVWLGHFTMAVFSVHGLLFVIIWTANGHLIKKVLQWKGDGISNFPGVVALVAGLLMWATSFQYTRIHAFELFFYTHQLYIVFIVGMALHVGDFLYGICSIGILLFMFDRFLRFCQSRKTVLALSAKVLPCGTFEVVLPKPSDLQYNALSFIFLNIPALGRLQWHPFSVSSSPKDDPDSIKFLIKPLGTWTRQLNETITKAAASKCPLRLKTGVEGPYGHETSYFLDYENLLLVAGGIGVSPFIAIIRDILHRYRQNEPHLPKDVTLIWAVKHREELAILDSLSPQSICPDYAGRFILTVKVFVTKDTEADVEAGEEKSLVSQAPYNPDASQQAISHLVGSGDILWVGAAIAAALFGYLLASGLVGMFYVIPIEQNNHGIVPWWVKGGVEVLAQLFGVVVFGGTVILLWHLVSSRRSAAKSSPTEEPLLKDSQEGGDEGVRVEKLVQPSNTIYGKRPDLQEAFEGCAKRLSGSNVGVLVCGPEGLQSGVASQCRSFNLSSFGKVAFSYHSVSFDL